MAQYLVLIYESEADYAAGGEQAWKDAMVAHNDFSAKHGDSIRGGEALQGSATATSIRDSVVTDGPFAETKELLGGYYVIEADDLDAALAIAKDVPAKFGGVEVRPIMTFD
jgi:hypothetical protein